MLTAAELCEELHIEHEVLERWVGDGWLTPAVEDRSARYADIDVARARLILELSAEFEINDQGIEIIVDLIDQIHGLRSALRGVLATR